jgi:CRP/FNR family cyclic AMP-dependent transcriptional regulator
MRDKKLLFQKFGKVFPAGTILFEEGQPCLGMYIIQKGRVRLYKKAGEKKVTIEVLENGDFFGEMACLLNLPRSINAVVVEDSEILVVDPDVLEEMFRERGGLGIKFLGNLASRLKKAYEIIGQMAEEKDRPSGKEPQLP